MVYTLVMKFEDYLQEDYARPNCEDFSTIRCICSHGNETYKAVPCSRIGECVGCTIRWASRWSHRIIAGVESRPQTQWNVLTLTAPSVDPGVDEMMARWRLWRKHELRGHFLRIGELQDRGALHFHLLVQRDMVPTFAGPLDGQTFNSWYFEISDQARAFVDVLVKHGFGWVSDCEALRGNAYQIANYLAGYLTGAGDKIVASIKREDGRQIRMADTSRGWLVEPLSGSITGRKVEFMERQLDNLTPSCCPSPGGLHERELKEKEDYYVWADRFAKAIRGTQTASVAAVGDYCSEAKNLALGPAFSHAISTLAADSKAQTGREAEDSFRTIIKGWASAIRWSGNIIRTVNPTAPVAVGGTEEITTKAENRYQRQRRRRSTGERIHFTLTQALEAANIPLAFVTLWPKIAWLVPNHILWRALHGRDSDTTDLRGAFDPPRYGQSDVSDPDSEWGKLAAFAQGASGGHVSQWARDRGA